MVLRDDGMQVIAINMCIYFGGCDTLMAQHILHGPQVGAAFYEVAGERMTERMRTDFLFEVDFGCQITNDDEYHNPGKVCTASIEEHNIFMAGLDFLVYPYFVQVNAEKLNGLGADRYQSLLAPLTLHFDKLHIEEQVGNL